jgi:hypothetical protein
MRRIDISAKTEYKYVQKCTNTYTKQIHYEAHLTISGVSIGFKSFDNIRDAAIHVDKMLLEHGKQPVNILKRKI